MKSYPINSPEAQARILTLCLIADSDIDPSELDELNLSLVYEALNISPQGFMEVFRTYLEDITAEAGKGRINLLDPERINTMLAEVNGRSERINTLATALRICKSDHALNDAEIALFRHIMNEWQIDLTDLEIEVSLA
ncbi:hypothetical protein [Neisseria sp.]|uniref:hypothetical protein n=1 Tax=Neisseria sp. TaxID=192066 RepID=UPI0028A2C0D5|nr:hypothetical protein [Neisseria sp.]